MSTSDGGQVELRLTNLTPEQASAVLELLRHPRLLKPVEDVGPRELDELLKRANAKTRENALRLVRFTRELEGVGDPVPERPKNGRKPRYFRLARGGQSFAYVWVRRDHLRVTLALPQKVAAELGGPVEVRGVQATNRFKLAVRIRGQADVHAAEAALKAAYERAA